MKVYLAARFSRRDELEQEARPVFEAAGWTVISRWHREQTSAPIDGAMANHSAADNAEYAQRDLEDVQACDALVLFTEAPESAWPRGARHVEYGYALALGKSVYLIGPRENVFHWLLPDSAVSVSVDALIRVFEGGA